MQKILYAIYDVKSGVYSDPYSAINAEIAIRDFTYACTQETESNLYRHAQDYILYQVGNYQDTNAAVTADLSQLITGASLLPLQYQIKRQNQNLDQTQPTSGDQI